MRAIFSMRTANENSSLIRNRAAIAIRVVLSFPWSASTASLHYRNYSVSIRVRALCLNHRNALASISATQTKHESKTLCSNDANSISKPRIGRITRMKSLRYSYSCHSHYSWSNLFAEIPHALTLRDSVPLAQISLRF